MPIGAGSMQKNSFESGWAGNAPLLTVLHIFGRSSFGNINEMTTYRQCEYRDTLCLPVLGGKGTFVISHSRSFQTIRNMLHY